MRLAAFVLLASVGAGHAQDAPLMTCQMIDAEKNLVVFEVRSSRDLSLVLNILDNRADLYRTGRGEPRRHTRCRGNRQRSQSDRRGVDRTASLGRCAGDDLCQSDPTRTAPDILAIATAIRRLFALWAETQGEE